jgi:ligand-binding sensor domain-containing protein/two-component sensor histidine kinase
MQDRKGFWWIGTDNGLQRWDGYRFINYNSDPVNKNTLHSDRVLKLMEDSKNNIWIAHVDGVTVYNVSKNLFTRVSIDTSEKKSPLKETINSLFEDKWHNVWIAGNGTGLQCYNDSLSRFVPYTSKLPRFGIRFQFAVQQPSNGNYWFGTDSGLVCYDVSRKKYFNKEHDSQRSKILANAKLQFPYACFYLDKKETLWLCNWPSSADAYLPCYYACDINNDSVTIFNTGFLNEVRSAVEDLYGRIWLGGGLLHYFEPVTKQFRYVKKQPSSKLGMDYDELNTVDCDRNGNIWLATDNGVYIFDPAAKPINTYEADTAFIKEPDPNFSVTSFLEYDKNNIWVTTWGRGAFLYDSLFRVKKRIFGPGKNRQLQMAWCATPDANGHIWFGWQDGVLLEYDPVTSKEYYYQPEALRTKTIRQLVSDHAGNIWMGTQRGLLAVCNTKTKQVTRIWDGEADGGPVGNIMSMKTDNRQHLWIGSTHNGLFEMDMNDGKVLRHFSKQGGSLYFTDVSDMCFFNDTTLLITSTGGIEILNTITGKVNLFEYPALRTNNIKAVEKGKNNDVYLAGPTGIFRISLPEMKLQVYGEQEGLLFTIFSESAHTMLQDGRVCFGTSRNFVTVNDKNREEKNPVALISGIRIMNQPVPVDSLVRFKNTVELTYDRNYVAIDFAAPAMMLKPNNTFLYKMEGFDKDWKIAAKYPSAEYSNLPPGRYRFLLKYRNTNGLDSNEGAVIPFIIHPPFYLRWWFVAIVFGMIGAILYLLHRIRVNKLLTMEKVRIHIARDLHDDMGSTLSSINILSVMSSKTIEKEPARTKEYLERISDNSQRMMDSMDDIVWSINPLNDTMERIVARMREVAANILEPKNIEYSFRVDEAVNHLKLDMSKRRDVFLIFKEAMNNMAKYSECTKAIIHITAKKNRFIMHIEDNGCGFDETILEDGNGLINMRKRAEGLEGRLIIQSIINQGTELTLNIPV